MSTISPPPVRRLTCSLCLALLLAPVSRAQSVDTIINRHVEAIGGLQAIEAIGTIRYERVYAHLEEDALYHHVICEKRPGKSRNERLGSDYCVIVNGTRRWSRVISSVDGTVEWEEDEYLRGVSNNFERRIGPFIGYRRKGIGLEYIAAEILDGRTMDHLEMTWPDGRVWQLYFDTGTGLWSAFRSNERSLSWIFDYRPTGDILFPHLVETRGTLPDGTPAHHLNLITSVELNVALEDSLFHPDRSIAPISADAHRAEEELTNPIGMRFRLIPAGSFMMGSDTPQAQQDEEPLHEVILSEPFYLGIHEVTQEQFRRVMGTNPSSFTGEEHPVEMVSWEDAQAFCRELSRLTGERYRLPTEAEWEYAARAGTRSMYYWGAGDDHRYAVYDTSGTAPVGSRRPNPWGLYDMSGNVWEWCADRYGEDYYRNAPELDPGGPDSGTFRVLRGGSWRNGAANLRIARRGWNRPDRGHSHDGFRVVKVVKQIHQLPQDAVRDSICIVP
ncbi:formylglycine-generating enzyme family protein [Gemmatimonadota bacterium]